jgi:O-acetyl-ADP-ribose deacetylase (regulator of RNase III)
MEYVESGLEYLAKNYDKLGIKSVAIPALGCGLGGLEWEDVKEKIISILSELDNNINIEIYEPF